MRLAKIVGCAQSVTKSDELYGTDILIALPVEVDTLEKNGAPFLVMDRLGAKAGQVVICASGSPFTTGMTDNGMIDDRVVAIPESLEFEGENYFEQVAREEAPDEEYEQAEVPDIYAAYEEYVPAQQEEQQNVEVADLVTDLTAEFRALREELDQSEREAVAITSEQPVEPTTEKVPQVTSTVPYEEYAKYLTTEFKPVEVPSDSYMRPVGQDEETAAADDEKLEYESEETAGMREEDEDKKSTFSRLDKYRSKKKK